MEEDIDTAEDILTFDAIGNWRTIKNENDQYEKVFVPGLDVHQTLKTILREIREENEEYREYSLKMKKYGIPETRLIPLYVSSSNDNAILTTILKIFVCYTLPIKKDDSCYEDLRIGLLRFLEAFIANNAFAILLDFVSEAIASDFFDRDKTQSLQIELTLTLIRNLNCIENRVEDAKSVYSHIHENLIKAMYDGLIVESLSILCVEEQSSYHWMLLEIFCLMINDANPQDVCNSIHEKNAGSKSSLRSLLHSELQKSQFYEEQLPSSFSDSYNITSVNRVITCGRKVHNFVYKPRTVYIPRRAKRYVFNGGSTLRSYLRPLYHAMVFIISSCYNDYINILQKQIKKKKDLIPADYHNYLVFTAFCNRFTVCFLSNPPPLKDQELTVEKVATSTTQDFLVYCLDLCKKLNMEEIQWINAIPIFRNISALFDLFTWILNQKGKEWEATKYKIEIVLNAVMTQVEYMQLLPDTLVRWRPKDGVCPFLALIVSIDSLLRICENLRDRGTTLLKRKHGKNASTVESSETGEEVTTIEFTEVNFSLHFIINLLYRQIVLDKYIYLLYNYKHLTAEINQCLFDYFQFMIDYVDETGNLTDNVEYNDRHHEELVHTLRPRLFSVQLFEVLNRILHDPELSTPTSRREDIAHLANVAKRVFELFSAMASKHPVLFAEALFTMNPSTACLISRGYHTLETTSGTIAMSSSVLNGSTLVDQKEVDIDALPVTPEGPEVPETPSKPARRLRRKKVVNEHKLTSDYEGEKEVVFSDGPQDDQESEDEVVVRRSVRASQPDIHITDDETSTDDGGEEDNDLPLPDEEIPPQPLSQSQSIRRTRPVRSIVQLSSDEEETVDVKEWNEDDDKKLKECFEQYKDMLDPWSMVVYDSYFMKNHRSKEMILKRAEELQLKEPEEEIPSKKRKVVLDDSDLHTCSQTTKLYQFQPKFTFNHGMCKASSQGR